MTSVPLPPDAMLWRAHLNEVRRSAVCWLLVEGCMQRDRFSTGHDIHQAEAGVRQSEWGRRLGGYAARAAMYRESGSPAHAMQAAGKVAAVGRGLWEATQRWVQPHLSLVEIEKQVTRLYVGWPETFPQVSYLGMDDVLADTPLGEAVDNLDRSLAHTRRPFSLGSITPRHIELAQEVCTGAFGVMMDYWAEACPPDRPIVAPAPGARSGTMYPWLPPPQPVQPAAQSYGPPPYG